MNKAIFLFVLIFTLTLPAQAASLKPYAGKGPTPELKLEDLEGRLHDLNDYAGQVVLLQFWATYCTPCRKEMPSMNKLMKKMGDVPFKILAIDMGEEKDEVIKFVDEVRPEFTILMDPAGEAIAAWQVFAAPSNFIIDAQGKIRYTLFGGIEWDADKMVELLKTLQ